MSFNRLQQNSPMENMHSELLMHLNSHDLNSVVDTSNPHFEIAAWLTLKNTKQLPAILLLEYVNNAGEFWQIIDIATIRFIDGVVLLSGALDLEAKRVNEVNIYLCHPSLELFQCPEVSRVQEKNWSGNTIFEELFS